MLVTLFVRLKFCSCSLDSVSLATYASYCLSTDLTSSVFMESACGPRAVAPRCLHRGCLMRCQVVIELESSCATGCNKWSGLRCSHTDNILHRGDHTGLWDHRNVPCHRLPCELTHLHRHCLVVLRHESLDAILVY